MKSDLHLHTTASDGRLTPTELVKMAFSKGIEVMAITDHDSVSGIPEAMEAAKNCAGVKIVPGVEIGTDLPSGELHMLGYFFDYKDVEFCKSLADIQESRIGRAQRMVEKLRKLGVLIEWERVKELAHGESICRPHIASAMLEKGFVSTEREAFEKYISREGPAYVERKKIKPEQAVRIIADAGGIPVLAHPAGIPGLEQLLKGLIGSGLKGIEAYYGEYEQLTVERIVELAKKNDLIATGGSDYHHFQDGRETVLGSVNIPDESIIKLFSCAGKHLV